MITGKERGSLVNLLRKYLLVRRVGERSVFTNVLLIFRRSALSEPLWPHGLQQARPPSPSPSPRAGSNSCLLSRWHHPNISSSVDPFFSCLQSVPASGSFLMNQLFPSGGQSIGVSALASVLPTNIQGWFPLGLTGRISLQFKGLSSLLQHHASKASILRLSAFFMVTLTSAHDYWKNHGFVYVDLCWQSNGSAFYYAV